MKNKFVSNNSVSLHEGLFRVVIIINIILQLYRTYISTNNITNTNTINIISITITIAIRYKYQFLSDRWNNNFNNYLLSIIYLLSI